MTLKVRSITVLVEYPGPDILYLDVEAPGGIQEHLCWGDTSLTLKAEAGKGKGVELAVKLAKGEVPVIVVNTKTGERSAR